MTGFGSLRVVVAIAVLALGALVPAHAQESGDTRAGVIGAQQAEKAKALTPYVPSRAEKIINTAEEAVFLGEVAWHPYFESAYAGGGFTLGAGRITHIGSYNILDLRGSITFSGYKRLEAEFRAPRLFDRRGVLSVIGGWREATEVGFYGIGPDSSKDGRANYSFRQPYGSATLDIWPMRHLFVVTGGVEYTQWDQREGQGSDPSVDEVYTPDSLPGLGASPTYLHTMGRIGFDWRRGTSGIRPARGAASGYSRSGGYYGVRVHDFADTDDRYGFTLVNYELIQHVPILRDAWVVSLAGFVETSFPKDGQEIPFFMLPSLGGGSTLRGFPSWRFRDRHRMQATAEWRALVNRFLDVALFADAGKVVPRTGDLDFNDLETNFGIGFRLHGPTATALRIDFAKSNEGLQIVFAAKAAF